MKHINHSMKHLKRLGFHLGAKGKLLLGFFMLLSMLFVSGVLAVYELKSLSLEMSTMLRDGYRSVTYSHAMQSTLAKTQSLFFRLQLVQEASRGCYAQSFIELDSSFSWALEQASANLTYAGEADRVARIASYSDGYYALLRTSFRGDSLSLQGYMRRGVPLYDSINRNIDSLLSLNDRAVVSFTHMLRTHPIRALRPGIIIFSVGILFALLYTYLIDVFYFRPQRTLSQALEHYLHTGRWLEKPQPANAEFSALHSAVGQVIRRSELLQAEPKHP